MRLPPKTARWKRCVPRLALINVWISKGFYLHSLQSILKDHIAYRDVWHSTTRQRLGGVGACSGRYLLFPLQLIADRDDQRRLIGRTLHTDPLEQYFVIANEGDPLQGLLVRLHPFRLPRQCFSLHPQIRQRDIFITDKLRSASISLVADKELAFRPLQPLTIHLEDQDIVGNHTGARLTLPCADEAFCGFDIGV